MEDQNEKRRAVTFSCIQQGEHFRSLAGNGGFPAGSLFVKEGRQNHPVDISNGAVRIYHVDGARTVSFAPTELVYKLIDPP